MSRTGWNQVNLFSFCLVFSVQDSGLKLSWMGLCCHCPPYINVSALHSYLRFTALFWDLEVQETNPSTGCWWWCPSRINHSINVSCPSATHGSTIVWNSRWWGLTQECGNCEEDLPKKHLSPDSWLTVCETESWQTANSRPTVSWQFSADLLGDSQSTVSISDSRYTE